MISAIESIFIPVPVCLVISWCGGLGLAVMWIIYVWVLGLTATNLFVLGALTGFIIGPFYPLSFAWINQKLNVVPLLLAALCCGGGLGASALQKIGGKLYIKHLMRKLNLIWTHLIESSLFLNVHFCIEKTKENYVSS